LEGERGGGERGGIGKHVPRVRQERKATAEPACRRFHQHEAGNHGQRYAQDAGVGAVGAGMVVFVGVEGHDVSLGWIGTT